ncbi:Uncharacterised protein [Klebsiella pneumoniae]|uniref:Uncharacterized protein n=1 Tax=Klebsiella pneumoniae TaxID=573 RepID=A0A378H431_KLEPN|nr:Uncharacterised protein [Klebsiella pneumoniae]
MPQAKHPASAGLRLCRWENDGSTPYDTYYPQLEQFYSDINTDGMAIFGQTRPPHWYFYQGRRNVYV